MSYSDFYMRNFYTFFKATKLPKFAKEIDETIDDFIDCMRENADEVSPFISRDDERDFTYVVIFLISHTMTEPEFIAANSTIKVDPNIVQDIFRHVNARKSQVNMIAS